MTGWAVVEAAEETFATPSAMRVVARTTPKKTIARRGTRTHSDYPSVGLPARVSADGSDRNSPSSSVRVPRTPRQQKPMPPTSTVDERLAVPPGSPRAGRAPIALFRTLRIRRTPQCCPGDGSVRLPFGVIGQLAPFSAWGTSPSRRPRFAVMTPPSWPTVSSEINDRMKRAKAYQRREKRDRF